jgi:hypothetical protein
MALAAPIDFSGRETLLNLWTHRKCFDVDAFVDANGNCPAWLLQLCFLYTKPIQNLVEKNLTGKPAGPGRAEPRGAPRRSRPYRLPAAALDG